MKRTVIVSAVALALLGFGASPALADTAPTTTTEAAAPIPEGPSAGANGAGASTAPIPDQLSGPSSTGASEAVLPPDSTTPTEPRPEQGPADQGSANNGSANTGSSTGGKPSAGAAESTTNSGSGHTSGSSTRANPSRTSNTGGTAPERGATSASASSVSTDAPNDGTPAGETSAPAGANGSAGAEGSAAVDDPNDANGTGTDDAGTTASDDGTEEASTAGTADTDTTDSNADAPAQIDASVTVSSDEITESDLYFEGITVTVAGLEPGDRVTNSLDDEVAAARSSTVEFTYLPEDFVEPGVVDFTITVAREGVADQVIRYEFTVVSDSDVVEGTLTMSASRMSVSDFADKGIDFTAEPFAQDGPVLGLAFSDDSEDALYFDGDLTADSSGRVSGIVTANGDAEPVPGDYHLFVLSDGAEASADFTLTEDIAPTEPANSGTESTASKDTELPHTQNESASRARTSAHWSRAGSAWSDSEDDSESAALPRTGAELGSLGAGGALLIAGVAMVAITARRRSESK